MILVFMGPPGSGKGTQAALLKEKFSFLPISTGDMFRLAIKNKTEVGILAKSYIDKGLLVPDEVTNRIVKERLENKDYLKGGLILDGYPRTIEQANYLKSILKDLNLFLDKVVFFDLQDEIIIERLTNRRLCLKCNQIFNIKSLGDQNTCPNCNDKLIQRDDDKEEVIKRRLVTYRKDTAPLIDYYKKENKIVFIDANQDINNIFEEVKVKVLNDNY